MVLIVYEVPEFGKDMSQAISKSGGSWCDFEDTRNSVDVTLDGNMVDFCIPDCWPRLCKNRSCCGRVPNNNSDSTMIMRMGKTLSENMVWMRDRHMRRGWGWCMVFWIRVMDGKRCDDNTKERLSPNRVLWIVYVVVSLRERKWIVFLLSRAVNRDDENGQVDLPAYSYPCHDSLSFSRVLLDGSTPTSHEVHLAVEGFQPMTNDLYHQ